MASVQSVHMNYDPLSSAPSGTKRKIGEVGISPGLATETNDLEAETPGTAGSGPPGDPSEPRGEMSESKRRAQNRAAQRAFRERKERHLKELETRLAQLESESRSWKSTNMALRSQLSLLEEELQHYRRPQGEPAIAGPSMDAHPSGVAAHMLPQSSQAQPQQQQQFASSQYQAPTADHNGNGAAAGSSSHNGNSPDSMSIPGLSFDSPGSAASSTPNRADEFCDKLSMACGTRDRPVPVGAPQIAAESPRWQEDAVLNGINVDWSRRISAGVTNPFTGDLTLPEADPFHLPGADNAGSGGFGGVGKAGSAEDTLNLDFGIMASGFGGFGAQMGTGSNAAESSFNTGAFPTNNMSGLLNNDFGMFDPLEDMLEWNPAKDHVQSSAQQQHPPQQQHGQPQQPQSLPAQQAVRQDQSHISRPVPPRQPQDVSPASSSTSPGNGQARGQVQTFKMEDSDTRQMSLGFFGGSKDIPPLNGLEEQVPAASQRFIPCSDVWDRICSHPRFGEIDINSMCQELRSHARCSNTGVVLDEEDVNKVLGTIE